jgi:hypothetical protein
MTDEKQSNHSVLLPPSETKGGLIKFPKKNPELDVDHVFKVPDAGPKGKHEDFFFFFYIDLHLFFFILFRKDPYLA